MSGIDLASTTALGSSGLAVPPLCFGTTALGDMPLTYGYSVQEDQARATLNAIFDSPVPFLDSSRNYGMGRSEERVGAAIKARGGLPPGFIISTKLDRDNDTGKFDGAQARRSFAESLEALGVDRISLLHLHDPEHVPSLSDVTGPNGSLDVLFALKEEGLVDAVSLAAGPIDVMMPLLDDWDFDAIITHNRFSLINRNAEPLMDKAHAKGMAVLNAAPYSGGVLAKGPTNYKWVCYQEASEEALEPARQVEALCAKHEVPLGAAALQFSMRDPRIASTICGCGHPDHVTQTMDWATWDIPQALWEELAAFPASNEDPEASRVHTLG